MTAALPAVEIEPDSPADAAVVLQGIDGNEKGLQMLVFSTGRQGGVGIVVGSFGVGLDPGFNFSFVVFKQSP